MLFLYPKSSQSFKRLFSRTVGFFYFLKNQKEKEKMKFKNNNHQALFNNEAKIMNRHDNVKMAVLYLLTADFKLWNEAKRHIRRGNIDLDSIKVRNGNLKA